MPGKGGRLLQMRSCNTERYAFGGEEFRICEREKRVGEVRLGGDSVWDLSCLSFACQWGLQYRNKAKTISPRPLFSGRGFVRTESGCSEIAGILELEAHLQKLPSK